MAILIGTRGINRILRIYKIRATIKRNTPGSCVERLGKAVSKTGRLVRMVGITLERN